MERLKPMWRGISKRLDPVVILAAVFAVGGLVLFAIGYGVGAIVLGAGLSAIIGTVTGREAIHDQSAREANLGRKEKIYGPLYAELRALRTALSRVKEGEAPAPQWIDNGVETEPERIRYIPRGAAVPTLKWWPEFRKGYHDTDFSPTAQSLLDEVEERATTYNNAVEAARQAAIPILSSHIRTAIDAEQASARYERWKRQQAAHEASSALSGHELKTTFDWFGFFDDAIELIVATQWLTHWPAGIALSYSRALGWLLAERPDKAASYVQRNYPAEGATYPPPPLDWIQPIFEQAWPAMQQDPAMRAARDAVEGLFNRVQEAADMLADGLRRIQERYEGGEPLV